MPLIECTIEREGPTVINDGGFTFTFEENEHGHNVADVLAEGAVRRMLNFSWFRKYNPEKDYPELFKQEEKHVEHEAGEVGLALMEDAKEQEGADVQESKPEETEQQKPVETEREAIVARILLLHGEGHSAKVIADAVGRNKSYVYKIIKESKR